MITTSTPAERSEDVPVSNGDDTLYCGPRGLAVKILTRVDRSDAYLDKLLDYTLRSEELDDRDKRLLVELTTGVLRHRERLDWVLTGFYHGEFPKCIAVVKNAMRVALYQILFLDRIPHSAAVNEAVELVKRLKGGRSAGIVNGVLRNVIRKIDAITFPKSDGDAVHYLSVMESHPAWMVRRWVERLGPQETEELLKANNERPPISLRVLGDASVEEARKSIEASGARAERSTLLPNYLRVRRIAGLDDLDLFRSGRVTAQDEGSGLVVALASVKPGMRVIDMCAAPGGKSVAMAESMHGRGEIVALDKYEAKLGLLQRAADRCGFQGVIKPMQGDARTVDVEPADVVLVDAPCSGLGVVRRKPEIKWKREPEEIVRLAELQKEILQNAARLVKPGGALVYSTCTIEPEENQRIVESFLKEHPEFTLERADAYLPDSAVRREVVTSEGYLQTWPHRHETDGMFAARMKREE